ncbi:hypothetical protein Celaphus_00014253 [Cervus elaphus hippelaphus]|uniref:RAB44 n=1 Tax=Cervus elaphus hippelaphus TaxID=46360 RepID=A0A212D4N9_CEREH|nr:hypothetical protein Celaphus_00014253 [Cervus elaphus hippelaphus]
MREPADGQDAPVAPEPESWSSQSAEELQSFFQDCGAEERGFVTREDLANIFGSSLSSHRLHRKRPLLSKRGSVATSFPVVEEANSEEKEAFFAFMEQLGASNSLPEFPCPTGLCEDKLSEGGAGAGDLWPSSPSRQAEIWQLWRTLRQEEPQLAGNLEGFLAKMNSRLQEAQADKEGGRMLPGPPTPSRRDTDHHREVQQLYEEMEQQIQREKQQLQAESDSRGLALSSQMQEVLEAKEREVQRLTEGQKEFRCLSRVGEEPGAEERKAGDRGDQQFRSELTIEVCGLKPEHSELPQLDSQPTPGPPDRMQAEAEAEAPAPRKPSRGFARMGPQPGDGAGPPEPTQTLPTRAELEAQPRPRPTTTHAEGEQAPPKSREPRAENRPEDPRTDSGGPGLTPSPGDHAASEPLANPDYAFHVIFLGDANVGKTSFLHLLHQNSFATGLTATVGVDFRVKNLLVDNKRFALQLWDTAGQERYHSVTRQLLRKADGVVLMYDITSQESFVHVRYWLDCLQDAESDNVVILLLGNKTDCEEDRQVSTEAGQQLAQELGVSFGECSAALGHNILEPVVHLAR